MDNLTFIDKIALVAGYIVICGGIFVGAIALFVFYIPDRRAFKKYQKRSDEAIMDYAKKTDILEKSNTFIDALGEIIVVCKN